MPDDGTVYICERCRKVIDDNAPEIVKARTLIRERTLEGDDEPVEGLGVFFHKSCWRPSSRYRRVAEHQ